MRPRLDRNIYCIGMHAININTVRLDYPSQDGQCDKCGSVGPVMDSGTRYTHKTIKLLDREAIDIAAKRTILNWHTPA